MHGEQEVLHVRRRVRLLARVVSSPARREDLHHFREELRSIDDAREAAGGIFGGRLDKEDPAKSVIPPGQAECSEALASCYALVEQMKDGAQPMSSGATDILHQLQGIKKWLVEAAKAPGRVTLPDLQRHGGMLDKVDANRQAHGGIFGGDLATGDIPAGQAVLSSLLASSYKLLSELKAIVPEKKEA